MPRSTPTPQRRPRAVPAGFLLVPTAAERLAVHPQTLRAMAARGELRAIRLGGRLLIAENSVTALLATAETR